MAVIRLGDVEKFWPELFPVETSEGVFTEFERQFAAERCDVVDGGWLIYRSPRERDDDGSYIDRWHCVDVTIGQIPPVTVEVAPDGTVGGRHIVIDGTTHLSVSPSGLLTEYRLVSHGWIPADAE